MKKLEVKRVEECRNLRLRGYSFGEISATTCIAKSTIHPYLENIALSQEQKRNIAARVAKKNRAKINPRKNKCLPGREIIKPKPWFNGLVHVVAHYMFDGRVDADSCIYYSKDKYQINHMKKLLWKVFKARPYIKLRGNGVYGLTYYHVELANYIKIRKGELLTYLNNGASKLDKRIFLRAFFDDEGCVFYKGDKRRVRGYQKSSSTLREIRNLLSFFGIESKINNKGTNIEISRKENLLKFSKEINFSPKIYINPKRKNGIWKKKISKKKILDLLLDSYQK